MAVLDKYSTIYRRVTLLPMLMFILNT